MANKKVTLTRTSRISGKKYQAGEQVSVNEQVYQELVEAKAVANPEADKDTGDK